MSAAVLVADWPGRLVAMLAGAFIVAVWVWIQPPKGRQ